MNLNQTVLYIFVISVVSGCATFKVPANSTNNVKEIFRKANIVAPALLKQVKSYYRNPELAKSCFPLKGLEVESKLVNEFLNGSGYKLKLVDFSAWNLDVNYYNKGKSALISLHVKTENGKCVEFVLSEGFLGIE